MKFSRFSLLALLAGSLAAGSPAIAPKTVRDGIEAWQHSNYAEAVAIWRPLAQKGDADAAFNLGQAYRLGRGVTADVGTAKSWLEKAARAGHLDAQTTLGLLLFDSGARDAAMPWLRKAAERGEPRAMLVYGTALFNGDGVPRDVVMAYAYVSRAAALGLPPAKGTLEDLDSILPIEIRQKGVAIALGKAKGKPTAGAKSGTKVATAIPEKKPQATASTATARKPAQVAAAPPAPAAKGGWRIQLGAFSKASSAQSLYGRLSGTAPVAGHQPYYVAAGAVTRLQVGPYPSKAAAASACASLSAKGQACFPVEAK